MSPVTLVPAEATSPVDGARALIEEARRRHRRRRRWIGGAAVVLAAGTAVLVDGNSGTRGPAIVPGAGRHVAAPSPLCTSGPVTASPGVPGHEAAVLPDADGLCGGRAVRGMTLIGSGGGNGPAALQMGAKDADAPFSPGQLGLTSSLNQFWVLTTAVQRYGVRSLPLPLPITVAARHPGPAEVGVTVLSFDNDRSPGRILDSTFYNHRGWADTTAVPGRWHRNWLTTSVHSDANGGMNEFVLQGTVGVRWIQVAVVGSHLTLDEARAVAQATTA